MVIIFKLPFHSMTESTCGINILTLYKPQDPANIIWISASSNSVDRDVSHHNLRHEQTVRSAGQGGVGGWWGRHRQTEIRKSPMPYPYHSWGTIPWLQYSRWMCFIPTIHGTTFRGLSIALHCILTWHCLFHNYYVKATACRPALNGRKKFQVIAIQKLSPSRRLVHI